jgi:UbiD family decarboxylase
MRHRGEFNSRSDAGDDMAGPSSIDNQSLRGFLRMVEAEYPGEFLRIRQEVDPKFESTSMLFELDRIGRSPVVVFEKLKGKDMPLVTNVAGNRKLLAACLGVKPDDLPTAFRERCQKYIPCEVVGNAAWDEVVLEGDQIDLSTLPVPLQFSVDAATFGAFARW